MTSEPVFLHGDDLDREVAGILQQDNARAAVAFWGAGISSLMPKNKKAGQRLICNLMSGGTNPYEIEKILEFAEVKQLEDLHAKVYIGDSFAVIASANASANGLGLEGAEQSRWREAGTILSDKAAAAEWFEQLWKKHAQKISKQDLRKAKKLWRKRQQSKPTIDFSDFDPCGDEIPLPLWYQEAEYTIKDDSLQDQHWERTEELESAIASGVDVCTEEDRRFFEGKPRWGLHFRLRKTDDKVGARPGFEWAYLNGDIIREVCQYDGDETVYDCVIARRDPPPPPFNERDPGFIKAFTATINSGDFDDLLTDIDEEPGKPWYGSRIKKIEKLWRQVKQKYNEL